MQDAGVIVYLSRYVLELFSELCLLSADVENLGRFAAYFIQGHWGLNLANVPGIISVTCTLGGYVGCYFAETNYHY